MKFHKSRCDASSSISHQDQTVATTSMESQVSQSNYCNSLQFAFGLYTVQCTMATGCTPTRYSNMAIWMMEGNECGPFDDWRSYNVACNWCTHTPHNIEDYTSDCTHRAGVMKSGNYLLFGFINSAYCTGGDAYEGNETKTILSVKRHSNRVYVGVSCNLIANWNSICFEFSIRVSEEAGDALNLFCYIKIDFNYFSSLGDTRNDCDTTPIEPKLIDF